MKIYSGMKITKQDLMEMLGIDVELKAFSKLEEENLSYRLVEGAEYDTEILNCIKRIQSDTQIVGTSERTVVWENGWMENLVEFRDNLDTECLGPKYFHSGLPIRFRKGFIKSDNPKFQITIDLLVKRCLFELYGTPYQNIYEFGCGTGYNQVVLHEMFPDKELYGFDLTNSAVEILKLLREKLGYRVTGKTFDFTKPDKSIKVPENSVVFTFAALEQIGEKNQAFIDYLLEQDVDTVVHLEPIVEVYDDNNLLDYLAKWFHTKRHYLSGLLPYLEQLETDSKIELEKVQRLHLGNHNHEGYTLIVWHPKKDK